MNKGFIKIYRKIAENPMWVADTFSRGQAWIDMIMLANYKDSFIRVRGIRVDVKRGQLGWSEMALAERWKWSRGKVRRFLNELETVQQIVQQKNRIKSLITICNYSQYQSDNTTSGTTNGQQTVQQTDTNKNSKESKETYRRFAHLAISSKEVEKLKQDYDIANSEVDELLDSIENYKKNTKYTNLYLTCRSWLNKNQKKQEEMANPHDKATLKCIEHSNSTGLF